MRVYPSMYFEDLNFASKHFTELATNMPNTIQCRHIDEDFVESFPRGKFGKHDSLEIPILIEKQHRNSNITHGAKFRNDDRDKYFLLYNKSLKIPYFGHINVSERDWDDDSTNRSGYMFHVKIYIPYDWESNKLIYSDTCHAY